MIDTIMISNTEVRFKIGVDGEIRTTKLVISDFGCDIENKNVRSSHPNE